MKLSATEQAFIEKMGWGKARVTPIQGDASARRYTRLSVAGHSAVLMQTPLDQIASQTAFQSIAAYLRNLGLSAPTIFGEDIQNGLMLVEDFGDASYTSLLEQSPNQEVTLYDAAFDVLHILARTGTMGGLPVLSALELARLTAVTFEELPQDHSQRAAQATFQEGLLDIAKWMLRGAPVTVLRDFHAGNLIWLPERKGVQQVGVIDFQDALSGPAGYDLVSFLDDARRDIGLDLRTRLIRKYSDSLRISEDEMTARAALLSLQRNFRILGLFRRLARNGKPEYLRHMPRVAAHVLRAASHETLRPLQACAKAICDHYLKGTSKQANRGAMIMAAGFGTRMGPLTKSTPKPLIEVAGRALIDHARELTQGIGAAPVVINTHYRAAQMRHHLRHAAVILSDEQPHIRDSGGGLQQALRYFSDDAVFTLNSDNVWTGQNPLAALAKAWQPEKMDALMMLQPVDRATGREGSGDLGLDADGRICFDTAEKPYVFTGAQLIKTAPIAAVEAAIFGLREVWEGLAQSGRLYGVVHKGGWADVGHPEGIIAAENLLKASA